MYSICIYMYSRKYTQAAGAVCILLYFTPIHATHIQAPGCPLRIRTAVLSSRVKVPPPGKTGGSGSHVTPFPNAGLGFSRSVWV